MTYFADKNVLFIHIPKNAGKSIEAALGLTDHADLNNVGRRSLMNRVFTLLQRQTSNSVARTRLHGTLDVSFCAQHLTLQEIQLLHLVPAILETRTFAVFRNPLSRAVSTYKHFSSRQKVSQENFESFCKHWYTGAAPFNHNLLAHRRQQLDYLLDSRGQIAVDKILRFEHLESDFKEMCRNWGLGCRKLGHIGKQSDESDWAELYTDQSFRVIEKLFADDIAFFDTIKNHNSWLRD